MMSNTFIALLLVASATKMSTGTIWNFDQQLGSPVHWNGIPSHENSNNRVFYVPVAKYPVNYREPVAVNKYANENVIQKPTNIIINRPPAELRHFNRPHSSPFHLPIETQPRRPAPVITPAPAPTTVRSHFDSPIEEYLLHAQMPLSKARTFIIVNPEAKTEAEPLT